MVKKKIKKVVDNSDDISENFLESSCHFMYKIFGKKLLLNKKFKNFFDHQIYNKKYEGILKKANLKIIPKEYFISIFVLMVILFVFVILSNIVLFFINPVLTMLVFYAGIFALAGTGIFLYNYPVLLANTRRAEIDAAIPYLLPYLKILAKELNLSKILEIVGDFVIYKEIKHEFERISYYSDVLGYDIHSSIRETMQSCPSRQLSDIMNDLVTISNSGGDIYAYLDRKLSNLNQEIEALEKKNIETLLIFSQIYVVLLLISPLFFTIMSSILNLINFSASSSASTSLLQNIYPILGLLVILPLCYVGFMMLVYYSKPLYSRLKPIKNEA